MIPGDFDHQELIDFWGFMIGDDTLFPGDKPTRASEDEPVTDDILTKRAPTTTISFPASTSIDGAVGPLTSPQAATQSISVQRTFEEVQTSAYFGS